MTGTDAVMIVRLEDNILVDVNTGFTELTGFDRTEILGNPVSWLYRDKKDHERILKALSEEEEVHNLEVKYRTRDGNFRTGLSSSRIITLNGNKYILSITKDITEFKEIRNTLTKSEDIYRLLVENVSDVIWICDRNLKPLYYSPSIQQLRRVTPGEALGQPLNEILTPESLNILKEKIERELPVVRPGNDDLDSSVLTIELEMVRKDGSSVWTEMNMRTVRNTEGEVTGFIGVSRDITRRRMAEQALRESEERYRILFNAGSDAITVSGLDDEGRPAHFYTVNDMACLVVGYSRNELLEMGPLDLITERDRDRAERFFSLVIEQRRGITELGVQAKDGREIPMEISSHLFDLYDVPTFVNFCRDLTVQKREERDHQKIQAKLIQANKMTSLGLMVSSLAHEINNPNNTIMFNLRRFARTWDDTLPILRQYYDDHGEFNLGGIPFSELSLIFPKLMSGTLESSEMIKAIIENLKGFVRQSSDSMDFNVDLNDVVRSSVMLLESQVKKGVGRLAVDLGEDIPRFKGNPQKLVQVLVNLISNGLEALTRDDQTVTVSTSAPGDASIVELTVSDQGEGMDSEQFKKAFEPFFSTKLESGGTGLGLTITKMLVDEHGASMNIISSPDEGTEVRITFPIEHQMQVY
jgi:PAS domain S-box-containing protein